MTASSSPCGFTATGWRWYQDCDHEDTLDVACELHANEGGRRMVAAEARAAALQTAIEAARALLDSYAKEGHFIWGVTHLRNALTFPAAAAVGAVPEIPEAKCEHKQRGPHQVLDAFCEWTVDCPGPVPETPEKPRKEQR